SDEFLRRRAELEGFEYLEAYQQRSVVLGEDGDAGRVLTALYSTPGFLRMTEIQPLRGRLPDRSDVGQNAEPVVVLPHSVWVSALGGDPEAVGSTVEIGGEAHRVVAVMPEGFGFPYADDLWIPFDVRSSEGTIRMIGKLREGVELAQARSEMSVVARPDPTQSGPGAEIEHLVTGVTRPLADEGEVFVLAIPIGVLVLLLLVMATNVANLVLARNANRARELALRSALGASRPRMVGQLVAEVALMAILASALGVGLSQVGIDVVDARIRFPFWVDLSVKPSTVVFAAALGLLVTLVAGMVPALRATRNTSGDALRSAGSGASAVRFGRLTGALIVVQLTVCVGFLSSATLLGQSLLSYTWDRYGLPAEETLVAQLYFGFPQEVNDPESGLSDAQRTARRRDFMTEATRLRTLIQEEMVGTPGIGMTAVGSRFPGNESEKVYVEIEGSVAPARLVEVAEVGAGYFALLGAEPLVGQDFSSAGLGGDVGGARSGLALPAATTTDVALVNEPFVRERMGGSSPLGTRIRVTRAGNPSADPGDAPWLTVIGVVPDLGLNPGNPENAAGVYLPLGDTNILRLALRGDGEPGAWAPRLVETARRLDPQIQVQWS
ncbi:MAG: ABC transporter permease, partial [Longimicrobiales bacterium]|nr:ABC transporter permease [Longimicrobiales bacterium]